MAFLTDFILWLHGADTIHLILVLVTFIISLVFFIAVITTVDLDDYFGDEEDEEDNAKKLKKAHTATQLLKCVIFLWLIYMLLGPFWLDVIIANRPEYDFSNPAACYLPMVENMIIHLMLVFFFFFITEAFYIKALLFINVGNMIDRWVNFFYHSFLWLSFGTFLLKTYPCYVHRYFSYSLIFLSILAAAYWYFVVHKFQKMIIDDDDDCEKISIKQSYEERKSEEEIWRKIIRERNNHPDE